MRMKLTDSTIAALAHGGKRFAVRDTELTGFAVRVARTAKTWVYEYRPPGGGNPITHRIGTWPSLREPAARKIVQGLVVDVARGGDPRAERQQMQEKQKAARDLSLKKLLAPEGPYEQSLRARHLVNWKTAMSCLRRQLGALFERDPSTISRADMVRAITALQSAGKPGAARDLRKFSYGFLEWCVQQGHAANNPLAGWKEPKT